ncbi:hypothetical protein LOAG_15438, partial [Loa loa]
DNHAFRKFQTFFNVVIESGKKYCHFEGVDAEISMFLKGSSGHNILAAINILAEVNQNCENKIAA